MAKIHPSAVVSPDAELGVDVVIGPFCLVEAGAKIGPGCVLHSHVVVKTGAILGADNVLHEGVVIGGLGQHAHPPGPPGTVRIGDRNIIREHATLHRSIYADKETTVGNDNFLMGGVHIAHDCVVQDRIVFANYATLGGHVLVEERAFVSGLVAVHQFCRIGKLAMVGGLARITRDVPPYVTIDGDTGKVVGLNTVGLRRAGAGPAELAQLKSAYRLIYRSGLLWSEVVERLERDCTSGMAAHFPAFFRGGKRGVIPERRAAPASATVKLTDEATLETSMDMVEEQQRQLRRRAG